MQLNGLDLFAHFWIQEHFCCDAIALKRERDEAKLASITSFADA